jgi:hypothetical protein
VTAASRGHSPSTSADGAETPKVHVPRALWIALGLFAALNLLIALDLLLARPDRWSDVLTVHSWCRAWLRQGVSLYTTEKWFPDYPPNAIVTFSPIAMVRQEWIVGFWAVVSAALVPLLPWVVWRARRTSPVVAAALPVLCFLCWGSARVLLQFSVLSMTCAFIAVRLADERPVASGVWLGLALAKPHIAAPVALWSTLTGRWRTSVVAALAVGAQIAIFCVHASAPPMATALGLGRILTETYAGPRALTGITSLRAWIYPLAGSSSRAETIWYAVAILLLIVPCGMAVIASRRSSADPMPVLAVFSLWSLLTFYHNGHNLILLLPVFMFLIGTDDDKTRRQRFTLAALLQAAMMADAPIRLAGLRWAQGWTLAGTGNVDRFVVLAAFCYVPFLWWRVASRTPHAPIVQNGTLASIGQRR